METAIYLYPSISISIPKYYLLYEPLEKIGKSCSEPWHARGCGMFAPFTAAQLELCGVGENARRDLPKGAGKK